MKILNVMLGSGRGGIEQVFVDYSNALSQNHNLSVICFKKCQYIDELKKTRPIDVNILDSKSLYSFSTYKEARKIVEKINPDVVFLHGNRAIDIFCNPYVKAIAKHSCKFIATSHNYRNKRFKKLDYAIAITKDLQNDLITKCLKTEKVFYCPNTTKLPLEKNCDFSKPIIIGAMGRLHKVKGFDVLIKAMKIVIDKGFDVKLKIAGSGKEKDHLLHLVSDYGVEGDVEFLNWVDNKADFYNSIDIFALPSRSEAFGLSLIEAMSHTKPTIISDCKGPMEISNINTSSIIVKKEDKKDLAEAIIYLIEHPQEAKSMASMGYKTVKDNFSDRYLVKCLDEIIEKTFV